MAAVFGLGILIGRERGADGRWWLCVSDKLLFVVPAYEQVDGVGLLKGGAEGVSGA